MSIEGLLIGRVLGGRYRIEEVIGRGGMGAVYRALDERLGRLVALKVITLSGTGDPEARERLRARFFREARSAAALPHHPNVVPVYDYGSDEELGLDYLVMELLRGSDLATRLARSGPPPLAAGLKILLEAARGIAVGHRQGLIHRDIKPGNIFLTEPHPNEVQVRVVDFGIAKLADDEDTLGQLTQDGRVPHSPAYASPEQLRSLSHLTPASDVFSLGAVGYQLLTGDRPFSESDRNRMSLGLAVETRSLREKNPAIPGAVDAIIRRALSIDPAQRFRDADEMAIALERAMRLMADQPVDPYLAGAAVVTAADEAENRPATAAAATPLADDATRVFEQEDDDRTRLVFDDDDRTLLAPPPPPTAASRAPTPPAPAARPVKGVARPAAPVPPVPPRRKRGLGGFLVWGFALLTLAVAGMWFFNELSSGGGPLQMPEGTYAEQEVEEDPDPVVEDPAEMISPEEEAEAVNARGIRFYNARNLDSAFVYFRRAVELDGDIPEYRRNLGIALRELGDLAEADQQFERVIDMDPDLAATYRDRAEVQLARGDTTAAIALLEEYIRRESSPVRRAGATQELETLREAQQPNFPDILGDAVGPGGAPQQAPQNTPAPAPAPAPGSGGQ